MIAIDHETKRAFRDGSTRKRWKIYIGDIDDSLYAVESFEEDEETGYSLNVVFYNVPAGEYLIEVTHKEIGGITRIAVKTTEGQQYYYPEYVEAMGKDIVRFSEENAIEWIRVERQRVAWSELAVYLYKLAEKIENDRLVSESITYDERLCSGDELKFGLCEGAEFSFQYFDYKNIRGKQIRPFVSVQKFDGTWSEDIPLGWFTVKECSRQASTGIMKVVCYDALGSDLLNLSEDRDSLSLRYSDVTDDTEIAVLDLVMDFVESGEIEFVHNREPLQHTIRLNSYEVPESIPWDRITAGEIVYPYKRPVNPYRYPKIEGQKPTLWVHTITLEYSLLIEDLIWQISAIKGRMEAIEHNFERYLVNAFEEDYHDEWYNDDPFDTETIWDFCGNDGPTFNTIFGIYVVDNDGEWRYSTVQNRWYQERGTGPETEKINNISGLRGGYAHIEITLPYYISDNFEENEGVITPILFNENNRNYQYIDPQGNIHTAQFPYLTYVDGTPVDLNFIQAYEYDNVPAAFTKKIKMKDISQYTERDIFQSVYEMTCLYGRVDRVTGLISGVELNHNRLYPMESLYPSASLYPNGWSGSALSDATKAAEHTDKAMYEKLWADEGNIHKFRNLILTYKGLEPDPDYPDDRDKDQEVDKTIEKVVNADGTDDYTCSDNWLFKNLVWEDADAEAAADIMVSKMQNIRWFPFEMWCAGLPYIEAGDEVEISVENQTYSSYVLRRNLKGLQNLHDEIVNGTLDIF